MTAAKTEDWLEFVKMHGLGNDFVVVDLLSRPDATPDAEWSRLAIEICDRHFGIGADGILLMQPATGADFRMRIFNSDGSEAESCGNGIRCLGRYYRDRHFPASAEIHVEAGGGPVTIWPHDDGSVTVDMGPPTFMASEIPVILQGPDGVPGLEDGLVPANLTLRLDRSRTLMVNCVSMGNPHAVAFVAQRAFEGYPLDEVGPLVERHSSFPNRTNFELAQVVDPGRIRVQVWERGAGPTLACGTGACAVVAIAHRLNLVRSPVQVELPGGALSIEWDGIGNVLMTGPAEYVFTGDYSTARIPVGISAPA